MARWKERTTNTPIGQVLYLGLYRLEGAYSAPSYSQPHLGRCLRYCGCGGPGATLTDCAYEFKVSGKIAWAEFYKDIVKIIIWNEKRKKKISCLVFITEENSDGRSSTLRCRVRTSSI